MIILYLLLLLLAPSGYTFCYRPSAVCIPKISELNLSTKEIKLVHFKLYIISLGLFSFLIIKKLNSYYYLYTTIIIVVSFFFFIKEKEIKFALLLVVNHLSMIMVFLRWQDSERYEYSTPMYECFIYSYISLSSSERN